MTLSEFLLIIILMPLGALGVMAWTNLVAFIFIALPNWMIERARATAKEPTP